MAEYDEAKKVTAIKTVITYEIPDSDIEVLLEMAGYGINYWAKALHIVDRKVTIVDVAEGGFDGLSDTYHTNYTQLAEALVSIGTGQTQSGFEEYARRYLAEVSDNAAKEWAAGNIDADLADHVVQIAALGDIIYG